MHLYSGFKCTLLAAIFLFLGLQQLGCATQRGYDTPDQAVATLVDSVRNGNKPELMKILGPEAEDILYSGDPNVDKAAGQRFLNSYDQKHRFQTNDDGSLTLCVGDDDWPLPIPLVKREDKKNQWYFDTVAGKDEILNRRIGRDELDTIQTCLAVVDAQKEYAERDPQNLGIPTYAQKFLSDPGKKNGLYWPTEGNEPESPLGDLVAAAQQQGYSVDKSQAGPQPYHGYIYRMLKSQGPDASGGQRDYIIDGKMMGGFAVIATPATYGNSGIMTFIINQDGILYQRDLGEDTAKLAAKIDTFNPDSNWTKTANVNEPTTQKAEP